ncbi:MAG: outer membrane lipoprotein-sorting protein [Desulfatirhabdiaceae bacterium]
MKAIYLKRLPILLGLSLFVFLTGGSIVAGDLSPKEILRQSDEARGNLEGVKWSVFIDSMEKNEKQERYLNVSARGYDFLAVLTNPNKVKGQKLLMIGHNMWFMKPGVKKPVPISSRQKLVGGAVYGDIAATNYADDYEPSPLPDETVNGEPCYVFDLKAISKKTTYDLVKYWISKERIVGVKAEYFTVSGKLFKTAEFEYKNHISKDNPKPFISKMIITDALVQGNVTSLSFSDNELTRIPDSMFDLNLLINR